MSLRRAPALPVLLTVLVLAAVIGLSTPFFQDNLSESRHTRARQDLEVLRHAWSLRQGREPVTRRRADLATLRGRYLQEVPRDPWGNDYVYDPASGTLRSAGADGDAGGGDDVVVRLPASRAATWLGAVAAVRPDASTPGPVPATRPAPIPEGFRETARAPLSTFSLDVDTGSYSLARARIRAGLLPRREAVRVEEFVHALPAEDPLPEDADFAMASEVARGGEDGTLVLRLALRARAARREERAGLQLTFLVDTSGSMDGPRRLGLVRGSLEELSRQLRPADRVALVSFAAGARVELPMAELGDGEAFRAALTRLTPRGGTDLGAGLERAYQVAGAGPETGGTRRVVLCSDGATNTGETSTDALLERIRRHAAGGVLLTTLGFGMEGFRDDLMEQLANHGDGAHAYLDDLREARRVLVEELTGTLLTVAREARVQVEFDPRYVLAHRRLGFDNRALADEDFRRPDVDAGEVGAEHAVRALYRLVPTPDAPAGARLGVARLRWQLHDGSEVRELERELRLPSPHPAPSPALRRDLRAAAFAEALRAPGPRCEALARLAAASPAAPPPGEDPTTRELEELIRRAAELAARGESGPQRL